MSSMVKLFLILCSVSLALSSALPIHKLHLMCGFDVVAHAKVHFLVLKNGHTVPSNIYKISDEYGHVHFDSTINELLLAMREEKSEVRLLLSDQCGMNVKLVDCNLPYYQFEISLNDVLDSKDDFHRSPIVNLIDHTGKRTVQCV